MDSLVPKLPPRISRNRPRSNTVAPIIPPRGYRDSVDLINLHLSSDNSESAKHLSASFHASIATTCGQWDDLPPAELQLPPRGTISHLLDSHPPSALSRIPPHPITCAYSPSDLAESSSSSDTPAPCNHTLAATSCSVLHDFDPLSSGRSTLGACTTARDLLCAPGDGASQWAVCGEDGQMPNGLARDLDACSFHSCTSSHQSSDPFRYLDSGPVVPDFTWQLDQLFLGQPDSISPPPDLPPRSVTSTAVAATNGLHCSIGGSVSERDDKSTSCSLAVNRIQIEKCQGRLSCSDDIINFSSMVIELRRAFKYTDTSTNPGFITASLLDIEPQPVNITICIQYENQFSSFTSCVTSTVQHVIMQAVFSFDHVLSDTRPELYCLRVAGRCEYLLYGPQSLGCFKHVHECVRFRHDVHFYLLLFADIQRIFVRTHEDDIHDVELEEDKLLPSPQGQPLTYEKLSILLDCVNDEIAQLHHALVAHSSQMATDVTAQPLKSMTSSPSVDMKSSPTANMTSSALRCNRLRQSVKAVCSIIGRVETLDLMQSLLLLDTCLAEACSSNSDGSQSGSHTSALVTCSLHHLSEVSECLRNLLATFTRAFRTDFHVLRSSTGPLYRGVRDSHTVDDALLIHIACLHRLPLTTQVVGVDGGGWQEKDSHYVVAAQLYHGTRAFGTRLVSHVMSLNCQGFFPSVMCDQWFRFTDVPISSLSLESRLVLTVYLLRTDSSPPAHTGGTRTRDERHTSQEELGWTSIQLFDFSQYFVQDAHIALIWSPSSVKELGPAPSPISHSAAHTCPFITLNMPLMDYRIKYSSQPPACSEPLVGQDFTSLGENTQEMLMEVVDSYLLSEVSAEQRQLLWHSRMHLMHIPSALPRVLLAGDIWAPANSHHLSAVLAAWTELPAVDALQLLLPCFPEQAVRTYAVDRLRHLSEQDLLCYLPQLVQALKHELWYCSSLARFLLERSLGSVRVLHRFYWLLEQDLCECRHSCDTGTRSADRYLCLLTVLQRALKFVSGHNVQCSLLTESVIQQCLYEANQAVQLNSSSHARLQHLHASLHCLNVSLENTVYASTLPLDPGMEVTAVNVANCSYFHSNTLPLRLSFQCAHHTVPDCVPQSLAVIYKCGDDLRQDMLTIQMFRLMDRLWLRQHLDLRMITFDCMAVSHCSGLIEIVPCAETLREIQTDRGGIAAAFKANPIADWLSHHNPSAEQYACAVQNFTASCAAYCVATFVLGIGDRHNDNIMLKTSGHMFHIDFGKFLGDAQRFGMIKRDRAPFVLTSDMAYVINGGEKPSLQFQCFVDYCCRAYNILRHHANLFMNLFALMTTSGIPGLTKQAVEYIGKALSLHLSDQEAASMFTRLIWRSLGAWSTSVNFFIHSLAQLRFRETEAGSCTSSDSDDACLLSFVPRVHTEEDDGRLTHLSVEGYQKRYGPDKYYVYVVRLARASDTRTSCCVYRTYKQFLELHRKLSAMFPLVDFECLPRAGRLGRSHIKQVARQRTRYLAEFVGALWTKMADEVRHSPLIYTFVHALRSDQMNGFQSHLPTRDHRSTEDLAVVCTNQRPAHPHMATPTTGQIQMSFVHSRCVFSVLILHARNLGSGCEGSSQDRPNSYVKLYLLPDPHKSTKRKTRVVKKNFHPVFMETIVYRMPIHIVSKRSLHVTVWQQDLLQENVFLGAVSIPLSDYDLSVENNLWFSLTSVQ